MKQELHLKEINELRQKKKMEEQKLLLLQIMRHYLLANIIDRLEEYHKKANIPIDDNKRTSIVNQNVSLSTESLLNNKKSFCCV